LLQTNIYRRLAGWGAILPGCYREKYLSGKQGRSDKERKGVLALLIDGKLSKEISSILKISKQTVDTHRKNMLHKKKLGNTGELISKAIKWGWL